MSQTHQYHPGWPPTDLVLHPRFPVLFCLVPRVSYKMSPLSRLCPMRSLNLTVPEVSPQ